MEYLNENLLNKIAEELKITINQIEAVLNLLKEDKTVAFIARYRKEQTNGLNEEQINTISELLKEKTKRKKR